MARGGAEAGSAPRGRDGTPTGFHTRLALPRVRPSIGRTLVKNTPFLVTGLLACVLVPATSWAQEAATGDGDPVDTATRSATSPSSERYGVAVRALRWVSIPGWLLDAFTAENVPLSTFGSVGLEGFWRRQNHDIALGFVYQNMSPPDGNWLGKQEDPSLNTDFVQARDLALLALDVSIVGRRPITSLLSVRYGAGLGLAVVRGKVLRTSASAACTRQNAGDERACRPVICPSSGCTESILAGNAGGTDSPESPSRFEEDDVPGILPVLNLSLGLEMLVPQVPGFAVRLEGGFYDAFVAGLALVYLIP